MLFFLFVSWMLTGTPGVLNAEPGTNGAAIEKPTPKDKPTVVLPKTAAPRASEDCCGTDPPPPPRKPGTE